MTVSRVRLAQPKFRQGMNSLRSRIQIGSFQTPPEFPVTSTLFMNNHNTLIRTSLLGNIHGWIRGVSLDYKSNIYCTVGDAVWKLNLKNDQVEPQKLFQKEGATFRSVVWHEEKLFICDWCNHCIVQYDIKLGKFSILAGNGQEGNIDGPIKDATFSYPRGITTDKNGDLYITDYHHIRKISLSRDTVETIAGSCTGKLGGFQDGKALEALFDVPAGITVANDGTIYVTDVHGQCIRMIKDGIVSTIAGTPGKSGFRDGASRSSKFSFPHTLKLTDDGTLLVVDNNSLRKINLKQHQVITIQTKKNCFCIATDHGSVFLGTTEGDVLKLDNTWNTERFLWIGKMKEDPSYCPLARLPKEMVNEIQTQLITMYT